MNSVFTTYKSTIEMLTSRVFADVLEANKECESAVLEVSSEGLARIKFNVNDYESTYYLVAVQNVN